MSDRCTLTLDGATLLDTVVLRVECDEALSRDYECHVELVTKRQLDLETLIGSRATVSLATGSELTRDFHGCVVRASFEMVQRSADEIRAHLVIAPRLAIARVGAGCRIFRDLGVRDVVTRVLAEANPESGSAAPLEAASLEWSTNGTYEPRSHIVQHGESDYDFVLRLLAEEGIGLAVRNDLDEEKVVFFDDDTGLMEVAESMQLSFAHSEGFADRSRIITLRERRESSSDEAALRDYDPQKAATDLTSEDQAPQSTGRQVYAHPGGYREASAGAHRAEVLLQRLRVDARTLEGESNLHHLEPGRKASIVDHPRLDMNVDVAITRVVHRWEAGLADGVARYRNTFEAIPLEVPYRPPARSAPTLGGLHHAFVTGPSGSELHGSERGEVKVRFVWDRSGRVDDTSSTWARVGQFALSGPMIVPRVGFEVLVDYELGDLERPLVVGHVYNREAMPPYALPGGASMSSFQTATTDGGPGANELRFEDAGGGEQIMFNASYDYVCSVENDSSTNVHVDESSTTGSNSTCAVGANLTCNVSGARTLSVGANQSVNVEGDYNEGTTGAWSVSVGNRKDTVGGDLTENVSGTLTRDIGGLQNITAIGGFTRNVAGTSKVTVGGAWIEMTAASRATSCVGRIETVGALKMVKAKTMAVAAGAAYGMNAASESVKCGGNRTDTAAGAIGLSAGGGLSIEADNINVTAESKIVLNVGGSQIEITAGGVKMKSPSVDLGDVKEIPSNSHKSN